MLRTFSFALLLVIPLCVAVPAFSQVTEAESELLANAKSVQVYERAGLMPGRKQVFLSTGFNNASILEPAAARELQGKQVESIELVYTKYAESPTFDQASLNHRRLLALQSLLPSAFTQPFITWTLTGQQPSTTPDARKLFHGFVITYREAPTEESMKNEILYLEKALGTNLSAIGKLDSLADKGKTISTGEEEKWEFTTTIKVEMRDTLLLKSVEDAGMQRVDTLYDTGLFGRRVFYIYTTDTKGLEDLFALKPEDVPYGLDSVVGRVLNRHMKDWKNILLVSDLTGSMSPYSAQLLSWYKLNAESLPVKYFVFFNDGNRMADVDKMPGETGGIYSMPAGSFKEVMQLAEKTMRSGGGGDIPENNLEAILRAIDECKDCDAIVMIADNYSSPRDMKLLPKIKKPVKVILCGAQRGVKPDYLDIAKATGGSVHLMEQDITDLSSVKEGDVIKIGKQTYRLERDHFVAE